MSTQNDRTNTLSNPPTTNREARDRPDKDRPTEVHDPHSRDDPDTPSFWERIKPKTTGQWSAIAAFLSLMLAGVFYVSRLYPPGYHNPFTMAIGVLVAGYFPVALWFREQGFRARSRLDTVVYKLGNPATGLNAMVTSGKVESMPDGDYKLAKEVKRVTFGGFVGEWLKLEDVLSEEDQKHSAKAHKDPEDPSGTALDGRFTAPTKTDLHGDFYVVDADDLEWDMESKEVERRSKPPSYLEEGATGMIITELQLGAQREEARENELDIVRNILERQRRVIEDEKLPELDQALKIVEKIRPDDARRRQAGGGLHPDERSEAVDEVDREVEEDLS